MSHSLPRVFVIGSSLTLLLDPHLKQMTCGALRCARKGEEGFEIRRALRNLDVPRGASAGDSFMVLDYLRALDRGGSFWADIVLIHVGTHDIKKDRHTGKNQVALKDYRRNVAAIIEWFEQKRIKLIWIRNGPLDEVLHNKRSKGFQRFEKDLDEYNRAAEVLLARHQVPILDMAGFTRRLGPMNQLLKDHIHFKDKIVRLQAAFVAGYLINLTSRGRRRLNATV